MQNHEHDSPPLWQEALKLSARIAAPFALAYLVKNAIVRVPTGKYINLSRPDSHQPVATEQERCGVRLLKEVAQHLKKRDIEIEVLYEAFALGGKKIVDINSIKDIPHHRPDFAVYPATHMIPAPGNLLRDSSHIAFLEFGDIYSSKKSEQADHAHAAGVPHYTQLNDEGLMTVFRQFIQAPDQIIHSLFGNIFD